VSGRSVTFLVLNVDDIYIIDWKWYRTIQKCERLLRQ
jgi:hypothetical protein